MAQGMRQDPEGTCQSFLPITIRAVANVLVSQTNLLNKISFEGRIPLPIKGGGNIENHYSKVILKF